MEPGKTPDSQNNSEKKNKAEGIILPDFKLWNKYIVTKQYGTGIKIYK